MALPTRGFWSKCLWLPLLLACLGGCRRGQPEQQVTSPQIQQPPSPPPDRSLTPAEYIKLGLPAYDRPWLAADMVKTAEVLTAVAAKDAGQLPRMQSARSGVVFARLVAADQNLALSRDKSFPLQTRVQNALDSMRPLSAITKLYLNAFVNRKTGGAEIIEIIGSLLRYTVTMADLVDEQIPTFDKADPSYKTRMGGLEKTRQGMALTMAGSLQTLTEKENYPPAERLRLLELMQDPFPLIVSRLSPASRQETLVKVDNMLGDPTLKELWPGLKKLQAKLSQ